MTLLTNPGTASDPDVAELADPALLALDPDLEMLFAEVEAALTRARVPATRAAAVATADTGSGSGTGPVPGAVLAPVRGHRPHTGRATQRGPPHGTRTPRPATSVLPEVR